ncbi:MAG: tRNA (adenosine(37)-N6)-threonylcarbamoyltransferase complex dimerization subunit type 1 TsaB [Actinobacteria bacterium]|nr:tRNA (adenosine(37)-N6)-threonylcarbamoyltransferase complex dimerization subunit type 1 TsaB [Actinomycetota bacterium]
MTERLVLTLDGSTRVCGAALLRPRPCEECRTAEADHWETVARRSETDGHGQSRVLLQMLDDMLRELGREPRDLGAIVVGTGPGTFTGVRITVATGRALSLALKIPVLGVSTLAAVAAGAAAASREAGSQPPDVIVPTVDARRSQVFLGIYEAVGRNAAGDQPDEGVRCEYSRTAPYLVCGRDTLRATLADSGVGSERRVLIVAEHRDLIGADLKGLEFSRTAVEPERLLMGQELLREPAGAGPQGRELNPWLLSSLETGSTAERAGAVAEGEAMRSTAGPVAVAGAPEAVIPIYVRPPDADIHITKMKDPWAEIVGGRGRSGRE